MPVSESILASDESSLSLRAAINAKMKPKPFVASKVNSTMTVCLKSNEGIRHVSAAMAMVVEAIAAPLM